MSWNPFSYHKIIDFGWWGSHGDILGLFVDEGACLNELTEFPAGSDFLSKFISYLYFQNTGKYVIVFLFETKAFIKTCAFISYLFFVRFIWKEIWLAFSMQY